jgi:pimeloyl-ACP methyl ester carboxylesterase
VLAQASDSGHESAVPEALQLDIGELELAALAWGPREGRPVLASHGWLDNATTMARLAPILCDALDLRIVSLDLPGHGLSGHKRGPYHFVDWVADLVHAADALGWERFSLMGHSMGAGISSLVAGTVPERVERCVLIEGLGPMVDDPAQAARRLARSLRVEARKRGKPKRVFASPEDAAERLREAAKMEPESARILVERGLEQVEGGWSWRADPSLRIDSRLRLSEQHAQAFLRAIRCPVLLIQAHEGWPHPAELYAERRACVAELELAEIAGHHHVHLDDAEAVAARVIPFSRPLCEGKPP